jgi:glycosyltransferase involved in cell wall biosynthesis
MNRGISIVLCTHNGARYLEDQITSLMRQSSPAEEIIISDDASTDGTRAIIEQFAREHPATVKVIFNNPALGFADNFLAACDHATQDWIAFCDQDDLWHPDKLARCRAAMDRDVTLIAHRARLIDAQGRPIGDFDQGIAQARRAAPLSYDLWGTFWGFSIVFRRALLGLCLRDRRFEDYIYADGRKIAHDRWVCFLAQMTGVCVEVPDRLADYRQHEANVAGAGQTMHVRAALAKQAMVENTMHEALLFADGCKAANESLKS